MVKDVGQLEHLKKIELAILKNFIDVCEELKLRYFAIDGTLLGAVRHKGFIPWDDDIDVGMPRKDFEIFMREGQKHLAEGYFLQNFRTDPEYVRGFAKIRDSRTAFIETAAEHLKMNHGIYIDIFPLDGYSYTKAGEIGFKLKKIMYDNKVDEAFGQNGSAPWKTALLGKLLGLISHGDTPQDGVRKRDQLSKRWDYDQADLVGSLYDSTYTREIIPKKYFGEGTLLPFEDIMIRVPANYDFYLKNMYGDYMQFPPENERVPQHACKVIDTERSYTYYFTQID